MPRVSLAEQYDNKDVVQQIYILKDGVVQNAEDIDALEDRMDTAEGDIDSLETRMDTAEQDIAQVREDMDGFQEDVDNLQMQVTENKEAMEQADAQLQQNIDTAKTELEAADAQLQQNIDTARTELEQADTQLQDNIDQNATDHIASAEIDNVGNGVLALTLKRNNEVELTDQTTIGTIRTCVLVAGSSERTFKLQFTMWDDSTYETNDFVIPEGGSGSVEVLNVQIAEGSESNTFKVRIQLSDSSYIDSNDYPFPVSSAYPTQLTLSLSGYTLTAQILMSDESTVTGTVDLSSIASSYTLPVATADTLGGVRIGSNVGVTSEGVISVDFSPLETEIAGKADTGTVTTINETIASMQETITNMQSTINTLNTQIEEMETEISSLGSGEMAGYGFVRENSSTSNMELIASIPIDSGNDIVVEVGCLTPNSGTTLYAAFPNATLENGVLYAYDNLYSGGTVFRILRNNSNIVCTAVVDGVTVPIDVTFLSS